MKRKWNRLIISNNVRTTRSIPGLRMSVILAWLYQILGLLRSIFQGLIRYDIYVNKSVSDNILDWFCALLVSQETLTIRAWSPSSSPHQPYSGVCLRPKPRFWTLKSLGHFSSTATGSFWFSFSRKSIFPFVWSQEKLTSMSSKANGPHQVHFISHIAGVCLRPKPRIWTLV